MEQSEKREQKAREEKEIEVSSIGKAFVKGTLNSRIIAIALPV